MLPGKVVISMLLAINMNRFMWLLRREICLAFYCANRQKILVNTGLCYYNNYSLGRLHVRLPTRYSHAHARVLVTFKTFLLRVTKCRV